MKQIFIGMAGLYASGKTTLANRLAKDLKISHIRDDSMRDFLISEIRYYSKAQYSHRSLLVDSLNKIIYKLKHGNL